MNRVYKVIHKHSETTRVISTPKEVIKIREAVGLVEQVATASGLKTLWYHHLEQRV